MKIVGVVEHDDGLVEFEAYMKIEEAMALSVVRAVTNGRPKPTRIDMHSDDYHALLARLMYRSGRATALGETGRFLMHTSAGSVVVAAGGERPGTFRLVKGEGDPATPPGTLGRREAREGSDPEIA